MIKMDTDEFMGVYDKDTKEVFICKETIRNTVNNLIINGYKYKCSYTIEVVPTESKIYPTQYTYFQQPRFTDFKTFFYSKTYSYCDLGSHHGSVIPPENNAKYNDSNLIIIHYHHQNAENYVNNCKICLLNKYLLITTLSPQLSKISIAF
jgi:hypothetical protein